MNQPILSVKKLNTYFYSGETNTLNQSLFDISFDLYRGETLGIIGESGSGKTITLLSLFGLVDAQPGICSGEIWLNQNNKSINLLENINKIISIETANPDSLEIKKNDKAWKSNIEPKFQAIRGSQMAMIFQNPRLAFNPYISIGKQINETIRLHTKIKDITSAKEKVIEWLSAVKMDAPHIRYNNNPYGLSGGMCQRALIAMALSSEANIIIADEPTSGLDATIQSDILDLLEELKSKYNKSMIIVSHDLAVMRKITDKLLVYYKGNIVESGSSASVLNDFETIHPYTQSLIQAGNASNFIEENDNKLDQDLKGCPYNTHCQFASNFGQKCYNEKPPLLKQNEEHAIACWRFSHG